MGESEIKIQAAIIDRAESLRKAWPASGLESDQPYSSQMLGKMPGSSYAKVLAARFGRAPTRMPNGDCREQEAKR